MRFNLTLTQLFVIVGLSLIASISILSLGIYLRVVENGKNTRQIKGVSLEMPLGDIFNFAKPQNYSSKLQRIDLDSIRVNNKNQL